jgi:putative ABC transport system substrate-binding protein
MRRREFIAGFVGSAAVWPLAAHAQQGERVRRIGTLLSGREADPEMQSRIGALREGLKALGWVEGRSYKFEHRWWRLRARTLQRAAPVGRWSCWPARWSN